MLFHLHEVQWKYEKSLVYVAVSNSNALLTKEFHTAKNIHIKRVAKFGFHFMSRVPVHAVYAFFF